MFELKSCIDAIEKNTALYEAASFDKRNEAIDLIGLQVMEQVDELLQQAAQPRKLLLLKQRAEKIKQQLEAIDSHLFERLRSVIRMEGYRGKEFIQLLKEYVDVHLNPADPQEQPGYDSLDAFMNGLCSCRDLPEQTKALEPGMVFYQKTPARMVFELVERTRWSKDDVFVDLGSGPGQVAILVHLLTGITVKGIEFEPAFCDYARHCAAELHLPGVTFINADARQADYTEGTVFFMFTPFSGEMLQEVLALLKNASQLREIKIITLGPCIEQVALQNWLHAATPGDNNIYKLSFFNSI